MSHQHHKTTHHPGSIGAQNAHLLNSVTDAYRAMLDLAEQGFTVLDVQIGLRNPIITIQGGRRCRRFRSAVRMIRGRGDGRRCITMTTLHKGAQVEWEVRA